MDAELRTALRVWLLLLGLLGLSVGASLLPLGGFSPVASLGIALLKAILIFWFFMHLQQEGGLVRLAAIAAAAWLLILLVLSSADFLTRGVF